MDLSVKKKRLQREQKEVQKQEDFVYKKKIRAGKIRGHHTNYGCVLRTPEVLYKYGDTILIMVASCARPKYNYMYGTTGQGGGMRVPASHNTAGKQASADILQRG